MNTLTHRGSQAESYSHSRQHGYTVIEVLVVVVIIGILAAIAIAGYSAITQRADQTVIQTDLANGVKNLKNYKIFYKSYPTSFDSNNCPLTPKKDTASCLPLSSGSALAYYNGSATSFTLRETRKTYAYETSDTGTLTTYTLAATKPAQTATGGATMADGSVTVTISGAPTTAITGVRVVQHVAEYPVGSGSFRCTQTFTGRTTGSVVNNTLFLPGWTTVTDDFYNNTGCYGYLGDVPTDVYLTNSYGDSSKYSFIDYCTDQPVSGRTFCNEAP